MSTAFDKDLERAIEKMDSGPYEHSGAVPLKQDGEMAGEPADTEPVDYYRLRSLERDIRSLRRKLRLDRLLLLLLGAAVIGQLALNAWRSGLFNGLY